MEIITLGRFISFYKFCADVFNDKDLEDEYYLLLSIKDLRNAVAHNNCLINSLLPNTTVYKTNFNVNRELSRIGIKKGIRNRKMSNIRVQQIITLLYTHKKLVKSIGIYNHQCESLNNTVKRMFRHIDYYTSNETIVTTFNFLKLVIDKWFPYEYTEST